MSKITKILLGVLAIVIILAVYVYMTNKNGDSSSAAITAGSPTLVTAGPSPAAGIEEDTVTGQKFLATLLRLKELNINRAIFDDPTFTSLKDYGVTLIPETPGRNNPFAPLGEGSTYTGQTAQGAVFNASQSGQGANPFSAQSTAQPLPSAAPASASLAPQSQTNVKAAAPLPTVPANAPKTQAGTGPASTAKPSSGAKTLTPTSSPAPTKFFP